MKDNKTLKIIILITGILTVLLGIYTLVRPMRTFLSIGWILGILLFVNGIELVALSLSKENERNRRMYPPVFSKGTCRSCFTFQRYPEIHYRCNGSLYGRCCHPDLWYFPDCRRHKDIQHL